MSDSMISIAGVIAILLVLGIAFGLLDRKNFDLRWLLLAGLLVLVNDVLLTRFFGAMPGMFPSAEWNWQGKGMALLATLAIAAHPAFGWQQTGLTLRHEPGSLRTAFPMTLVYLAFFVAVALAFPNDDPSAETIAFQATMPGFEEEPFYRGILLVALYQAFRGRWRFLGIDWSWGALLSCLAFGLAHAFSYAEGSFGFDPLYMAFTAIPSLLSVWLVRRTGSLLLPVLVHNAGNVILHTV